MDVASYRRMVVLSLVALAAVVAALIALNPSGEAAAIPPPIERVFPLPGDTVVRQTAIELDLPVGYSLTLIVDGTTVPPDEIGVTEATGRNVWQPGPTSLLPAWTAGEHTIRADWQRRSGGTRDRGSFTWTFRVV